MPDREVVDLCIGAWAGALRQAHRQEDCQTSGCERVSFFRVGNGDRQQLAVSKSKRRKSAMIITRKHLPRRTFLKGVGAAVALPMLDAMTPALAAAPKSPV